MHLLCVDDQPAVFLLSLLAERGHASSLLFPKILHLLDLNSKATGLLAVPPLINKTLSLELLRIEVLQHVLLYDLFGFLALEDLLAAFLGEDGPFLVVGEA